MPDVVTLITVVSPSASPAHMQFLADFRAAMERYVESGGQVTLHLDRQEVIERLEAELAAARQLADTQGRTMADLEFEISELEETVRRLKADQPQPPPPGKEPGISDPPPPEPEFVPTHTVTPGVNANLRDDATGQEVLRAVPAGTLVKVLDTHALTIGGWTNRAKLALEDGLTGNLWWPRLEQVALGGGADDASLFWPTEFRVVTQRFGVNPEYYTPFGVAGHEGLDLRAPGSTNVYAAFAGRVVRQANTAGAYGNEVRVQGEVEGKRLVAVYAHLEHALVKQGDVVARGQVIGKADATGNVRPPGAHHLHFGLYEVDANGARLNEGNGFKGYVDPAPWLGL